MNVIMTESGRFVEVQGTAEKEPFSRKQLDQLLELAENGLGKIFEIQRKIVNDNADKAGTDNKPAAKRTKPGKELGSLGDVLGSVKL
ncbi:MAG: hypothetical protein WC071_13280, partial [Victivallaceae bacterium]